MPVQMSPLMRSALDDASRKLVGALSWRVLSARRSPALSRTPTSSSGTVPTVGPNFMPVIIEQFARERLEAVAQADGLVEKPLPEVLFVCERNAGRSQMAAALAHELSNGWVAVRSAGSHPDEQIDPVVVEAMAEIGLDVRMEFPKPLTDAVVRAADVVVTLGCGDACPVYPGQALPGLASRRSRRTAARGRAAGFATSIYHHVWS